MNGKHLVVATALGAAVHLPTMAQGVLTGDTRLACEAVMCLATGTRPDECMPSLRRYFSISHRKWSDTLRDRMDFLKQCPAAQSGDGKMKTLVNDIANGAGRCEAASLNAAGIVWQSDEGASYYINNAMPDYCSSYLQNANTDLKNTGPRYVGAPERNGYWVDASQYDQAVTEYNARTAAEDAVRGVGN